MDHGQGRLHPEFVLGLETHPLARRTGARGVAAPAAGGPGALDASIQPASVGLASFIGELSTPVQTVMSVAVMYTLPAVVFYLLAQKYIVSGMTAGGVKG